MALPLPHHQHPLTPDDDVPQLLPSHSSPSPFAAAGPSAWRRASTSSDHLYSPITPQTPSISCLLSPSVTTTPQFIPPAHRKRSSGSSGSYAHLTRDPHGVHHTQPRRYSSHQYCSEPDHIPLERGGSSEGRRRNSADTRRRSSTFALEHVVPAVPNVAEQPHKEDAAEAAASSTGLGTTITTTRAAAATSAPIPIPAATRARPRSREREAEHEGREVQVHAVHPRAAYPAHPAQAPAPHGHLPYPTAASSPPTTPTPVADNSRISAPHISALSQSRPQAQAPPLPPPPPMQPTLQPTPPIPPLPFRAAGTPLAASGAAGASSGGTPTPGTGTHTPSSSSEHESRTGSLRAAVRRRISSSKALAQLALLTRDDEPSAAPQPQPHAPPYSAPLPLHASATSPLGSPAPAPAGLPASSLQLGHAPAPSNTRRASSKLQSLIKSARRRRAQSLSSPIALSQPSSTLSTPSHPSSLYSPSPSTPGSIFRTPSLRARDAAMGSLSPLSMSVGMSPTSPLLMTPLATHTSLGAPLPPVTRRNASLYTRHMSLPTTSPFSVVLTSAGLQPVGSDELVWGTLSYRAPARTDYFTSRLPRELKVKVFSALLDSYAARPGPGRWDGVNAGRKELVRLSRVSREWQSLCFDGQLWASADFTPLAAVMHPGTLRQILMHARPCIKDLNMRGLDAITGWTLTVRELDSPPSALPPTLFSSLTTLDLFGCHDLSSKDIVDLLSMSPNLKVLNLKGSRLGLMYVLAAIAQHVTALEDLNLSRCWSLEFLDIEGFITSLNPVQKAAMRALRIAGLTSTTGGHLLHRIGADLTNLRTLDLLNCKWLGAIDIRDYIAALGDAPSPLTHLVISGCTNLTTDALDLLVDRLPYITHFEAAGLEPVFYLDPPPVLARLLRSMPRLIRLDLDSTGRYGGICDRVLEELIPGAVPGSPLHASELVELRIGGAKNVTSEGLLRLVSALPRLRTLEVDGTDADNAVLRAFLLRPRLSGSVSASGTGGMSISLVDCHRVTNDVYNSVAPRTRARKGWDDYRGTMFAYTDSEMVGSKPVLKTFWAWRAVRPPKLWREARALGESENPELSERQVVIKGNWWRSEDVEDMERGACVVM